MRRCGRWGAWAFPAVPAFPGLWTPAVCRGWVFPMVQGYYTLEEACRILGVAADELKAMSKRGELRAFQDRGTLRFRTQEVEEKARQRGVGSAPDLPLGEAPR